MVNSWRSASRWVSLSFRTDEKIFCVQYIWNLPHNIAWNIQYIVYTKNMSKWVIFSVFSAITFSSSQFSKVDNSQEQSLQQKQSSMFILFLITAKGKGHPKKFSFNACSTFVVGYGNKPRYKFDYCVSLYQNSLTKKF